MLRRTPTRPSEFACLRTAELLHTIFKVDPTAKLCLVLSGRKSRRGPTRLEDEAREARKPFTVEGPYPPDYRERPEYLDGLPQKASRRRRMAAELKIPSFERHLRLRNKSFPRFIASWLRVNGVAQAQTTKLRPFHKKLVERITPPVSSCKPLQPFVLTLVACQKCTKKFSACRSVGAGVHHGACGCCVWQSAALHCSAAQPAMCLPFLVTFRN